MIGSGSGCHQSTDTGRDGNHQYTRYGDVEAVSVGDADESHYGSCDGRTCDTHLRGNGSHGARALRADALFQGNVADNRHQSIYHVPRTHKYREEESGERSQECDAVGMLTQKALSHLDEPVHTARGLHDASTGDGCDDDIDYVGRGSAWLEAESENKDGQADTRDCSQGQTAITRAYPQRSEYDTELQNHSECNHNKKVLSF